MKTMIISWIIKKEFIHHQANAIKQPTYISRNFTPHSKTLLLIHNYHTLRLWLQEYRGLWDGIFTKTHPYYLKELGISNRIEAYMQF